MERKKTGICQIDHMEWLRESLMTAENQGPLMLNQQLPGKPQS